MCFGRLRSWKTILYTTFILSTLVITKQILLILNRTEGELSKYRLNSDYSTNFNEELTFSNYNGQQPEVAALHHVESAIKHHVDVDEDGHAAISAVRSVSSIHNSGDEPSAVGLPNIIETGLGNEEEDVPESNQVLKSSSSSSTSSSTTPSTTPSSSIAAKKGFVKKTKTSKSSSTTKKKKKKKRRKSWKVIKENRKKYYSDNGVIWDETHGFIIPGWEPEKSLDTRDYINHDALDSLLIPKMSPELPQSRVGTDFDTGDGRATPQLLIGVQSGPNNLKNRDEVRRTWGGLCAKTNWCKYFFSIGLSRENEINDKIVHEYEEFKDILVDPFYDAYNNLTLKTLYIMRYFKLTPRFDVLLKTDDDSYIGLVPLKAVLEEKFSHASSQYEGEEEQSEKVSLLGYLQVHYQEKNKVSSAVAKSLPIAHKPSKKLPKRLWKWVIPKYMYSEKTYPAFLSGSGYLADKSAAGCILEKSKDVSIVSLEDVYTTGLCAEACDLVRYHHDGFSPTKKPDNYTYHDGNIVLHYMADRMDLMHSQASELYDNFKGL